MHKSTVREKNAKMLDAKIRRYLDDTCKSLGGKRVLVLGATGSIGGAAALELLYCGCSLVCAYRSERKRHELEGRVAAFCGEEKLSSDVRYARVDLSDFACVRAFAEEFPSRYGQVDCVLNCAGVYHLPSEKNADGQDIHVATNVLSAVILCDLFSKNGAVKEKWLNTGSISCLFSDRNAGNVIGREEKNKTRLYAATKRLLAEYTCESGRSAGFRTALAHPGISATSLFAEEKGGFSRSFQKWIFPLMKRVFPSPEQAALSLLYALSHDSAEGCWTGPSIFGIWGKPKTTRLSAGVTKGAKEDVEKLRAAVSDYLREEKDG